MNPKTENQQTYDPFATWQTMRDAGMDMWSKMMIQVVNSEAYAKATGVMMDAWLTSSAPFRKTIETAMTQTLTQLNMPTRADVVSMAERLTQIETRLDDLDAKLAGARPPLDS